jgi:hypothetical protein
MIAPRADPGAGKDRRARADPDVMTDDSVSGPGSGIEGAFRGRAVTAEDHEGVITR